MVVNSCCYYYSNNVSEIAKSFCQNSSQKKVNPKIHEKFLETGKEQPTQT